MDFGYSISKPRALVFDTADRRIAEELQAIIPVLRSCIGCGNCTATCTAGAITSFNVRKLHTLLRRGETAGLRTEFDKCMLCGKCRMVCPRGINTRQMIVNIKRLLEEA